MNSQGIVENAKCGRFCKTLTGDANLWYESELLVGNDWNHMQRLFVDNSQSWNTHENYSKEGDPSHW